MRVDYTGLVSVTIAVGIAIGLVYTRRTGWSAGGLVTPGLLALHASDPLAFSGAILTGLVLALALRPIRIALCLYGRERVGAALLISIALRLALRWGTGIDSLWIGWIVPGLIAADAERQGALMTAAGAVSTGIASAVVAFLILQIVGSPS
jgi:poly-gamma-glutamate biosynthesis protein PgsC/CapC